MGLEADEPKDEDNNHYDHNCIVVNDQVEK